MQTKRRENVQEFCLPFGLMAIGRC